MRRLIIFIIFFSSVELYSEIPDPDPQRFEKKISDFVSLDTQNSFLESSVLFLGSSSIVFWNTAEAFPNLYVLNRGFGGSHISDQLFYFDNIVIKYRPSKIVFYCGDNDIAAGKSVDQVINDFTLFIEKIKTEFQELEFYFIPIKPSIARWNMWGKMEKTNMIIKEICDADDTMFYVDIATPMLGEYGMPDGELFDDDCLHLNDKGYELWNKILARSISGNIND